VPQAVGLFAGTNVDDIVLLALLFARSPGSDGARRVVVGQFVGFAVLLAVSVLGALGAALLPADLVRLLGLVPLGMGLYLGWRAWREHRAGFDEAPSGIREHGVDGPADEHGVPEAGGLSALAVASLTVANGGDNIGVYVPAFAASGPMSLWVYVPVFLVLTGVWCVAGRYVAERPVIARSIERREHILLPVVLVAIGLIVLLG
jgi:cadmium resistance protein CadD (predicted permease)